LLTLPKGLAIDEESILTVFGLDREVVAPSEQLLFHHVAHTTSLPCHSNRNSARSLIGPTLVHPRRGEKYNPMAEL
jgi:hypothetical protein